MSSLAGGRRFDIPRPGLSSACKGFRGSFGFGFFGSEPIKGFARCFVLLA